MKKLLNAAARAAVTAPLVQRRCGSAAPAPTAALPDADPGWVVGQGHDNLSSESQPPGTAKRGSTEVRRVRQCEKVPTGARRIETIIRSRNSDRQMGKTLTRSGAEGREKLAKLLAKWARRPRSRHVYADVRGENLVRGLQADRNDGEHGTDTKLSAPPSRRKDAAS